MRENNAYCFLLRIAHFLIFIYNGGILKVTIQPRLNNCTHFSCYRFASRGEQIIEGYPKTITFFNIPET